MLHSAAIRTSLCFVAIAIACLFLADLAIVTIDPWQEFRRMLTGALTPTLLSFDTIIDVLLKTVAFAFIGVAVGSVSGFLLTFIYHRRLVRASCAFARAVHELFWALLFLQITGLHPLTGVLAIAIPYAGVFAKVYSEIMEESDQRAIITLPIKTGIISEYLFARLPDAWSHLKSYTLYRMECGLRSSAVLGFVGLPTLGFQLHSVFMQGYYSEVAGLLFLFYVLIATIRWWMRPWLLPVYLIGSLLALKSRFDLSLDNAVRFLSEDIVPAPLRDGAGLTELMQWGNHLLVDQALPGTLNTIILSQIALVLTGILALLFFPLISRLFFGRVGKLIGHLLLVVTRSTPEYILAFIFLQLWGPSMLPAIIALSLHNAAIIGHLLGKHSNTLTLRQDHASGLNLYCFEIVPRLYGQFLAFLFYRWEIIFRETAVVGILGIYTLGFYIDSAMQDLRFDRALFLIIITGLLTLLIDKVSRSIRKKLRLDSRLELDR